MRCRWWQEDCHNFIRVLVLHDNLVFACGTNSYSPQCSWRQVSSSRGCYHRHRQTCQDGMKNTGERFCPVAPFPSPSVLFSPLSFILLSPPSSFPSRSSPFPPVPKSIAIGWRVLSTPLRGQGQTPTASSFLHILSLKLARFPSKIKCMRIFFAGEKAWVNRTCARLSQDWERSSSFLPSCVIHHQHR